MKQGEIWYANLNPVKGSEQAGLPLPKRNIKHASEEGYAQAGFRPVVVLSGNLINQYLPVVIVAPLTTKIKNYKGNPVLHPKKENGLTCTSELLIFHIRSVSTDRMIEKIGKIEKQEIALAIKTLNDILTY